MSELERLQRENEKLQREIEDLQKLCRTQREYGKECEKSFALDVARKIGCEYADFVGSLDEPMDLELGEIYREKLRTVFSRLIKNGIPVDAC